MTCSNRCLCFFSSGFTVSHLLFVTKSSYELGKTVVFEKTPKEKNKSRSQIWQSKACYVRVSGAAASFLLEFFEFFIRSISQYLVSVGIQKCCTQFLCWKAIATLLDTLFCDSNYWIMVIIFVVLIRAYFWPQFRAIFSNFTLTNYWNTSIFMSFWLKFACLL